MHVCVRACVEGSQSHVVGVTVRKNCRLRGLTAGDLLNLD